MISGRRGKFEKQDQRRLDQDWMTGFDNKDQLEMLAQQWKIARQEVDAIRKIATINEQSMKQSEELLKVLDSLLALDFSTIDLPSAEADWKRSEDRLQALLDPKLRGHPS